MAAYGCSRLVVAARWRRGRASDRWLVTAPACALHTRAPRCVPLGQQRVCKQRDLECVASTTVTGTTDGGTRLRLLCGRLLALCVGPGVPQARSELPFHSVACLSRMLIAYILESCCIFSFLRSLCIAALCSIRLASAPRHQSCSRFFSRLTCCLLRPAISLRALAQGGSGRLALKPLAAEPSCFALPLISAA